MGQVLLLASLYGDFELVFEGEVDLNKLNNDFMKRAAFVHQHPTQVRVRAAKRAILEQQKLEICRDIQRWIPYITKRSINQEQAY